METRRACFGCMRSRRCLRSALGRCGAGMRSGASGSWGLPLRGRLGAVRSALAAEARRRMDEGKRWAKAEKGWPQEGRTGSIAAACKRTGRSWGTRGFCGATPSARGTWRRRAPGTSPGGGSGSGNGTVPGMPWCSCSGHGGEGCCWRIWDAPPGAKARALLGPLQVVGLAGGHPLPIKYCGTPSPSCAEGRGAPRTGTWR